MLLAKLLERLSAQVGLKTVTIRDNERGLLLVRGRFNRVLAPGRHRFFDPSDQHVIELYDLNQPLFNRPGADVLLREYPRLEQEHLELQRTDEDHIGLCFQHSNLIDVIPPAAVHTYWRSPEPITVEFINVAEEIKVGAKLVPALSGGRRLCSGRSAEDLILTSEVPARHIGLLYVNGCLIDELPPGRHAFWRVRDKVRIVLLDLRQQMLEISGQEMLTKDKVSLRLNLTAAWRITDPQALLSGLSSYQDSLYKELQFGLREAVSAESLDTLLGDKHSLNASVLAYVQERLNPFGIELSSVGVKDIILPGEMRSILNQVVEAEKQAQANLIRRREETAATRSLNNTAKMMEQSPVLLRLKELEALESITARIDRVTVFGGLEGLLKDLVQIKNLDQ